MEEWRKYRDTYYEVSNYGRIRSNSRNKVTYLKPQLSSKGYYHLGINHKKSFVHRLVAECFIDLIPNKPHVNHKNCIKTDNNATNLEWCNIYENNDHAQLNGLGSMAIPCTVINLKNDTVGEFGSFSKAMKILGTMRGYIFIKSSENSDELRLQLIEKRLNGKRKPRKKRSIDPNRRFNEDQVRLIRELATRDGFYVSRIARIMTCDRSLVDLILQGKLYVDIV